MYVARRSSSESRIPACSPADTRLQNSGSKYSGYLRNAWFRLEPVSMSERTSFSSFETDAFAWPRPTMSNACSSGTPAFIIVASWRVNSVTSLSLIFLPVLNVCFLILVTRMPCLRNDALTSASPAARISPRTFLPLRSLPSQANIDSLVAGPARQSWLSPSSLSVLIAGRDPAPAASRRPVAPTARTGMTTVRTTAKRTVAAAAASRAH